MPDSSKRPVEDVMSGRERKKRKIQLARTINVQSNSVLPPEQNPSPNVPNGMKGLPSSVQVEKFVDARAFEINAMQSAMQSAKDNSSKRVWQTLPRHLRRRAASHDVRRVPVRLRDKAQAEMDPVLKKKAKRKLAKRGKQNEINRTETLLKRQRDKSWLETHIWHAKRMKMENLWGYRLAVQPTEKAFRPSHRAAVNGSILHDISYFGTIELKGRQTILKSVLAQCCDPRDSPNSQRYVNGARICETFAYHAGAFPLQLISPITILWMPPKDSVTVDEATQRTTWVRVHPAAFQLVHEQLRKASSTVLQALHDQRGPTTGATKTIEIADLRNDINAFEITGPRSNQVLAGALKLVKNSENGTKAVWQSLRNLQNSGSVPRGMVIGFTIQDPRLSYPPNNAKPDAINDPSSSSAAFATVPSEEIARSDIWDSQLRDKLQKPKYKKKDIDERRSQALVPGTPLQPLQDDDRIPLILIQRTISCSSGRTHSSSPPLHGWTLLFPAGWSMPLLSSLTHSGTRVGGLRERHNQHFEASKPHYPEDFVTTAAYREVWGTREDIERGKWERTPKAKRVAYNALGVRSPFRADWEVILGLNQPSVADSETVQPALIPTQPDQPIEEEDQPGNEGPVEWLLRGPALDIIMKQAAESETPEEVLYEYINENRIKSHLAGLTITSKDLLSGALILVKIALCSRGVPGDLGIIYNIEDVEEENQLRAELASKGGVTKEGVIDNEATGQEGAYRMPDTSSIIGYITTGHFSLQQGRGFALGAVSVSKLLQIMKRDISRSPKEPRNLVKVRDRDGLIWRLACLEISSC